MDQKTEQCDTNAILEILHILSQTARQCGERLLCFPKRPVSGRLTESLCALLVTHFARGATELKGKQKKDFGGLWRSKPRSSSQRSILLRRVAARSRTTLTW